eukprot:jgi/Hompol1/50/HPOL_005210-RA
MSDNSDPAALSAIAPAPPALPAGRKRKWDVQEPEPTVEVAVESPGSGSGSAQPASSVSAAARAASPESSTTSLAKRTQASSSLTIPQDSDSAIAMTAAATSAIVAQLSSTSTTLKPRAHAGDLEFFKDIDINDAKNRQSTASYRALYLLTKHATQMKIQQETGADITTRGKYYPDRNRATEKDPPLYLHVMARTQEILDKALIAVNEIIEQASITLVEPRTRPERSFIHEKIYVDIEAPVTMNLRAKIVGPGGAFMKHIQSESGTRVQLRGRGSGFTESSTGQEADEPMFINISGQNQNDVDVARKLCDDLLDTVKRDVEKIMLRMKPSVAAGAAASS